MFPCFTRKKPKTSPPDKQVAPRKRPEGNCLVCGPAGCGKSSIILRGQIDRAIQEGKSIFLYGEQRLLEKCMPQFQDNGYHIRLLDSLDREAPDIWLPLSELFGADGKASRVRAGVFGQSVLTASYFREKESEAMQYRRTAQQHLFLALLLYYAVNQSVAEATQPNLLFRNLVQAEDYGEVFSSKECPETAKKEYDMYAMLCGQFQQDRFENDFRTRMRDYIEMFPEQLSCGQTAFSLASLANEKTAVFVSSSGLQRSKYLNLLLEFLYIDLFDAADTTGTRKCKVPVQIILDEFATIAPVPGIDKKLATSRARNVYTTIAVQNVSQIRAVYHNEANAIIGNCLSHIDGNIEMAARHLFETTNKQQEDQNGETAEMHLFHAVLYAAKEMQAGRFNKETSTMHELIATVDNALKTIARNRKWADHLAEYCNTINSEAANHYAEFCRIAADNQDIHIKALRARTEQYLRG